MRIIGGKYGSRKIKAKIPPNVRPTTDRVRESMFNILNNLIDFDSIYVLDLFAGTGAFGFESLSRGAAFAQFIEINGRTVALIKNIAQDLNIPKDDFSVIAGDAVKYLNNPHELTHKFNLVFADPPYDNDVYSRLMADLPDSGLLSEDSLIVVEYRTINKLPDSKNLNLISDRIFGDTGFKIFEKVK
ncbi:MAG: 16S rRNA (guanine(966)-N(2))-methyltransferase RsmD [Candidatus Kapabacteria bacterium]|nr:16S rRNA (guanine(966)-N(2))-methyltransferase RsmD [Candidatus Kapabacteria bacterium]